MQFNSSMLEPLLIEPRSNDKRFHKEVRAEAFYPADTGHQNFYGTRKTDGGRPKKYSDLLRRKLGRIGVLNGLGCGDSGVEAALLQEFGTIDTTYHAVDCSHSMLTVTKERLAAFRGEIVTIESDFTSRVLIDEIISRSNTLMKGNVVSTILGRTFGNHPAHVWEAGALRLLDIGDLLIDYYSINSSSEVRDFKRRMNEIRKESSSFFTHPLLRAGVDPKGIELQLEFSSSTYGVTANFFTCLGNPEQAILLHQIRGVDSKKFSEWLKKNGVTIRHKYSLTDQLAPMDLVCLSKSSELTRAGFA